MLTYRQWHENLILDQIILDQIRFCDTSWVQENLSNQNVIIIEVDYDPQTAYNEGHLPNAHLVSWKKDINDALSRDILNKQQFEELMSRVGTTSDSE